MKERPETHVESLYRRAVLAELDGVDFVAGCDWSVVEAEYNSIGPDCMNAQDRARFTAYLTIFEPATLIHDMRFFASDGTRHSFNYANIEFRDNCLKLANGEYPWWNWRRYRARAVARILYAAAKTNIAWDIWRKYAGKRNEGGDHDR